jgi:hypothetical protein
MLETIASLNQLGEEADVIEVCARNKSNNSHFNLLHYITAQLDEFLCHGWCQRRCDSVCLLTERCSGFISLCLFSFL